MPRQKTWSCNYGGVLAGVVVGLAALGCQSSATSEATSAVASEVSDLPGAEVSAQSAQAAEVTVQMATWEQTQQLVADQVGKVVVVDIWSTYCVPCMREFPELVKLHREYPDRVVCISLNCNYAGLPDEPPEHSRPVVEKFLRAQGATMRNLICSEPDEQLFERLDLGSIPTVLVYDQRGQLSKRFDNDAEEFGVEGFSYAEHIVPLVESLLTSGGGISNQEPISQ